MSAPTGRVAAAAAIAATALVVWTTPAAAGIQNVQSALATDAPEGLSGNVTGSVDWRTGNISFVFLSAVGAIRWRGGPNLLVALVTLERKSSGDSIIVERTFEHVRYRRDLSPKLLVEAFLQHEFDGVKRLSIRTVAGAGPRYQIVEEESYGLGVGFAYMFEYELLKDDMEIDAGDDDFASRLSSYLVGHYEINDRFQLIETFYVQPRLTDFADIRLLSESSMVVKATDKLSLKTSLTVAFDNRSPAGIEETDTALKSALTYEF